MKTQVMNVGEINGGCNNEEKVARVVVLGRKGVGKTALVVRCLTKRFLPEYAPCSEAHYRYKKKDMKDGRELEMVIIDSDGQNTDIYPSSEAFILVYSVTSRKSLQSVEAIIRKIKILNRNDAAIIVVANQIDLIQKREVSTFEGASIANKYQTEYYEISVAKDVDKVTELFSQICQRISLDPRNKKTSQKIFDMFKRRGSS